MSSEENNEDRLTKNEFSELIQHLSMQEILSIEYLVSHDWAKLFTRKNMSFTCNLCLVDMSSFKSLLDHINGKKHKLEMVNVKQLYHPDYTYPKNGNKEFTVLKGTKHTVNSLSTLLTSTEFAGITSNRQENFEEQMKSNKNNIRNININEIKPNISKNQNISSSEKMSTNVNIAKEINKEQYEFNEQQKSYGNLVKSVELNEKLQKDNADSNVEKIINNGQEKQSNMLTPNSESLFLRDNKNISESSLNFIAKNLSLCIETMKGDINCDSKSGKEVGGKNVISDNPAKSCQGIAQEENVKVDSKNTKESSIKAPKLVINPAAAALASKKVSLNLKEKNECEENKPKYQTDKTLIPTANKDKMRNEKKPQSCTSQSHLNDFPIFSVKSYSSKSEDIDVHGILGVEYVIKIFRHKNDSSPRYECGLCELVLDGFAMQRHLEGYNHRLKFCEKHFPTAVRHYRQYMQCVPEHELFKVMTPVLEKLAKAIESHHGRNLPYECYERDFNLNRHEILAKAFSCRHACEQYGPTFTHVIGADEIDELINGRQNYAPPKTSRVAIFDIKPGKTIIRSDLMRIQDVRKTGQDSLSRDQNRHSGRKARNYLSKDGSHKSYMSSEIFDDFRPQANICKQPQQVDDKTYNLMVDNFLKGTLKGISGNSKHRDCQKRSVSPFRELNSKKRRSLSPLRDNDIWQAYRHMVDQELNNLEDKFKQYRENPEMHPSYNEEWQKFWKRRKDELISDGLDHRNYNYQPEWMKFIKVRTEELYNEEIEKIKIKCRERLCLPMTNSHLMDIKYHVRVVTTSTDCFNTSLNSDVRPIGISTKTLPAVKVNSPQVVSVLRLMTALEDSLGSLGPKIINLLSKALQAEKSNPTLLNAIILTDENCSLIETAKEKFKGLVITGLFEGSKERVLQKVINDTESLLKYAYQNRKFLASQRSSDTTHRMQNCTTFTEQPLIEEHLLSAENLLPCTNKKELASKLAASFIAQGKTDFNPQQLQQLFAVCNVIEKKKRGLVSFVSDKETAAISKKKLSETLSELLKSSSTSRQSTVNIDNQLCSNFNSVQRNQAINATSTTSFNSILRNSGGNYLINLNHPQLPESVYGINVIKRNQFEHNSDFNSNYSNNRISYQQNSFVKNELYQNNNRTAQSWMVNSNKEMNSNHDISRPSSSNNQPTNWRNF